MSLSLPFSMKKLVSPLGPKQTNNKTSNASRDLCAAPAGKSNLQPATRNLQHVTCNLQPATCNLQPATRNFLLLLGFLLFALSSSAQFDTKHYLPPVWTGTTNTWLNADIYIVISTSVKQDVNFTLKKSDGTPIDSSTCKSGTPYTKNLGSYRSDATPGNIYGVSNAFTVLDGRGLIVEADFPVCVNTKVVVGGDQWSVTSKGKTALGRDFRTGHMRSEGYNTSYKSSNVFTVLAIEDNTSVTYTPTDPTCTVSANTITLNAGESYVVREQVTETESYNERLNGTHITSTKDIVVISGTHIAKLDNGAADSGLDEIVPTDICGSEYIVQYGSVNASNTKWENANVVAISDNTAIFKDGAYVTTIDAGENYRLEFTTTSTGYPMTIQLRDSSSTTGSLTIDQLSQINGYVYQDAGGGQGERGMSIIPSLQCKGTLYSEFASTGTSASINIVAMQGATVKYQYGSGTVTTLTSSNIIATKAINASESFDCYSITAPATDVMVKVSSDKLMHVGMMFGSTSNGLFAFFTNFTAPPLLTMGDINYSAEDNYLYATGMFTAAEWFYNGKSLGVKSVSGTRDSIEVSLPGTYSCAFESTGCGWTDTSSVVVKPNPAGPYPGGAADDVLWLRADKESADAGYWGNYAGHFYLDSVAQTSTANQPTLDSAVINFNPAYKFDGSNDRFDVFDYFKGVSDADVTIGNGTGAKEVFTVSINTKSANGGVFSLGDPSVGTAVQLHNLNFMNESGSNNWSVVSLAGVNSNNTYLKLNHNLDNVTTSKISTENPSILNYSLEENNSADNILFSGNASGMSTYNESYDGLLGLIPDCNLHGAGVGYQAVYNGGRTLFFGGNIAEVILFHDTLTTKERSKVNSYLAIKYGITLDMGVNAGAGQNYLASSGDTVWDASVNTVYNHDIFGIGLDSVSRLDQRVSKSINDTTVLTLSMSTDFDTTNLSDTRLAMAADLRFLMMGSNDSTVAVNDTAELPGSGAYNIRMKREWLVQPTDVGAENVYLRFDSCYTSTTTKYYMLVDDDGDFTTGNITSIELDAKGVPTALYSFTSNVYITVVAYQYAPGGVPQDLGLWVRADKDVDTTATGAVTLWDDWSMSVNDVLDQTSETGNFYKNNIINFNPAISQSASMQYLKTKNNIIGVDLFAVAQHTSTVDYGGVAGAKFGSTSDCGIRINKTTDLTYRNANTGDWGYTSNQGLFTVDASSSDRSYSLTQANTLYASYWGTANGSTTYPIVSGVPLYIGGYDGGSWTFTGYIPEVILYSARKSELERRKIETYLAVKYGITLDQSGAGTDYIASNGDTIWSAAENASGTNGAYNNNIFGIGRDDVEALDQRVSHSINNAGIDLTVALNLDFKTSNPDIIDSVGTADFDNNLQYLMISDNAADTTLNDAIYGGMFYGMDKAWRITVSDNFDQNVNFSFGSRYASSAKHKYYAVYKHGNDDFSTGAYHHEIDDFGNVANMPVADGYYFTIIYAPAITVAPGGVDSERLWLRADQEVTKENDKVKQWIDFSANGYNFSQGNAANQPGIDSCAINFNPAITLDEDVAGSYAGRDYLECKGGIVSALYSQDQTIFTVARKDTVGTDANDYDIIYYVANDSVTDEFVGYSLGGETGYVEMHINYDNGGEPIYHLRDGGLGASSSGHAAQWASYTNVPSLITGVHDNSDVMLSGNSLAGAKTYSGTFSGNTAKISRIGGFSGECTAVYPDRYKYFFGGHIAEVIAYTDSVLTDTAIMKVESYLALKYGITLDQSAPTDYIGSTGRVFWDASGAKTDATNDYNHDIFGMGRDDISLLYQCVSHSVNSDAILTVALENDFASANDTLIRTSSKGIQGGDYFMVGNNDSTVTVDKTTELPFGAKKRMAREWMVQKTNSFIQSVYLKFDGDYSTSGPGRYALVADTDGDGDFTTGGIDLLGYVDASGVVQNVSFTEDTTIMTIIYREYSPGGVFPELGLWLRADKNVGGTTSAVTDWTNQMMNNEIRSLPSSGAITLEETAINYNPAIYSSGGASNYLGLSNVPNSALTDGTKLAAYMVTTNMSSGGVQLSFVNSGGSGFNTFSFEGGKLTWGGASVPRVMSSHTEDASKPLLANLNYNNTSIVNYFNGGNATTGTDEDATSASGTFNLFRFENTAGQQYPSSGDIAEVIIYNADHISAATDRQKIESYLALKYGITLDQTSEYDYLASDSARMWDASDAGAFNKDIFGLGRDDIDSLYQRISRSVNGSAVLIVSLNNDFAGTNIAESRKIDTIDNLEFMTFSHNGGDTIANQTGNLPDSDHNSLRMDRIWRVHKTANFPNLVNMKFDLASAGSLTYHLYKTTGADGDFTSGSVTYLGRLDANGEITNIELDSADYFTLVVNKAPGGVMGNLQLWLRADGLTDRWGDKKWVDYHNLDTCTVENGTELNTTTKLHNFNPGVSFDGVDDYIDVYDGFSDFRNGMSSFIVANQAGVSVSAYTSLFDFRKGGSTDGHTGGVVSLKYDATNELNGIMREDGSFANEESFYKQSYKATATNPDQIYGFGTATYTSAEIGNALEPDFYVDGFDYGYDDMGTDEVQATDVWLRTDNYIGKGKHYYDDGSANGTTLDDDYFYGQIPEMIMYTNRLTLVEQVRVHTYLAIKYGITLNSDLDGDGSVREVLFGAITEGDYLSSDSTVIWDASAYSSYHNGIIGVGTDSLDMLLQRISHSVDSSAILILSTDSGFTAPNLGAGRNSLANGNFVVTGNNGADTTFTLAFDGYNNTRMARSWVFDITGTADSVYLAIPNTIAFPNGSAPAIVLSGGDDNFGTDDEIVPLNDDGLFYWAKVKPADALYYTFFGITDRADMKYIMRHGKYFKQGGEQPMEW